MASLTFANIETRTANRLRIPTSNATEMTKLDAVINDVYRRIASKKDWRWLYTRQVLTTTDDLSTGTISVTNGSTTATFSSAPAASVAGRILYVRANATEPATYRISTHTAATTGATLESAYTGATNTAAAFTVWQDRYALGSTYGKIVAVKRHGWATPVLPIGIQEMERMKQVSVATGAPQWVAVYGYNTEGDPTTTQQLHVFPYPDATYQLVIWFKQTLNTEVSGATRLFIPDDWVHVLEDGVLADGYAVFLNDLERASYYRQQHVDGLNLMVARLREFEDPILMQPEDNHRQFYRSRNRVSAATADLGSFFGRWPMAP